MKQLMKFHYTGMLPTAINVRINPTIYKILAQFPYMERIKHPSFSPSLKK